MVSAPNDPLADEVRTQLVNDPELLLIGQVVGAHGIKGGVRIKCSGSALDKFLHLSQVEVRIYQRGATTLHTLNYVQPNKGILIASFDGVEDRNAAEAMVGAEVFISRSEAGTLEEDEFWTKDLVGFEVYTLDGSHIGTICDTIATGSTLLELTPADSSRKGTILIPFVKEIVPHIHVAEKRIEIKPVPGLLDL